LVGKGRKIAAVKVVTLLRQTHWHFHLFLRLKKHLAGQIFHEEAEVKKDIITWLCAQAV
jgi:hypothetical protein